MALNPMMHRISQEQITIRHQVFKNYDLNIYKIEIYDKE